MDLSQRYKQAAKEASWALGGAILYVIGWCVCAYLPKNSPGPIGFPLWFELSCILFTYFVLSSFGYWDCQKLSFLDIPLDVESKENK